MEPVQPSAPPVLCSVLSVKSHSCEVTLDSGRALLSWREVRPRRGRERSRAGMCLTQAFHRARGSLTHRLPSAAHIVPVSEIVSVGEAEIDEKYYGMQWKHMCKPHAFTVHYVQRMKKHRWRCKAVTFWCSDELLCCHWLQALNDLLEQQTCRPKHLLVYINPYGGKKKGRQIYEKKVAPLFSLASITTDVIVTEYANHARDNLYEVNLDKYDGWVLYGSTDCVCFATVGINDPVTSALHIILGDSQPLDVSSVHDQKTLLKYTVSLLGYGFYGDVVKGSEKNRWLGPARYDFSGFKTFLSHRYYEGTVSFQPAEWAVGSPRDKIYCTSGCYICRQMEEQQTAETCGLQHNVVRTKTEIVFSLGFKTFLSHRYYEGTVSFQPAEWAVGSPRDKIYCTSGCYICRQMEEQQTAETCGLQHNEQENWKTVKGKFMAINAAIMSCACPRSPKGLSPAAHLADGTADLILVRKCSRINFLRHLIRHTKSNSDQFDFPFVEVYRIKTFQFTPKHSEDDDAESTDLGNIGKKNFPQICTDHPSCGCNQVNSVWNCDGESLEQTALEMRVHCQLIRLFARGIEDSHKEDDENPSRV
ncbi:PREDICTED: ceramide kinase [Nanorana parkeri]|uniref:ceramide kinase n=1 Tax=Nanorana parkeri TaxID=125878 RepID=UPI0008547F77|nr:PREDICTED: ceramide kinase [Nanorana parkeri]